MADAVRGLIFDIDSFAVHDGPGIRMSVYLKGCPLHCAWCHSPESQSPEPELAFARELCEACGACVAACPEGVHTLEPDSSRGIDRARCQACGACVAECLPGALSLKGRWGTADEIVAQAARLRPFFASSQGGVTLTGGEVTMQAEFAAAVLRGCRALGIHTAIETCGATTWERLALVADLADLILYDLKLMDEAAHRQYTGVSNRAILENAARLAGRNVQVRVPLIPGVTDTVDNIRATYAFMRRVGLERVALLPYNAAAGAKYEWLDRDYALEGLPQSAETLAALVALAGEYGVEATLD
jgi:pyruvate formate lyase activating enzyme